MRRKLIGIGVLGVGILLLAAYLFLRPHDKGDPIAISRDFIVALWNGDEARVKELTCDDDLFRQTVLRQTREADTTVTVDTSGLTFTIQTETDDRLVMLMGGTVVFTSQQGEQIVRDLDEQPTWFTLHDEGGWKICAIQ
ncbi:MAG TPA: hypothetical protein VHP83_09130 [Aggregatilineaceae bacterium]|nr:hypothetical protein [Aggregatilineaceae bacterium]